MRAPDSMARVARADAQGGWYLTQSTKGPATATYTFTVAKAGSYTLAARVHRSQHEF